MPRFNAVSTSVVSVFYRAVSYSINIILQQIHSYYGNQPPITSEVEWWARIPDSAIATERNRDAINGLCFHINHINLRWRERKWRKIPEMGDLISDGHWKQKKITCQMMVLHQWIISTNQTNFLRGWRAIQDDIRVRCTVIALFAEWPSASMRTKWSSTSV